MPRIWYGVLPDQTWICQHQPICQARITSVTTAAATISSTRATSNMDSSALTKILHQYISPLHKISLDQSTTISGSKLWLWPQKRLLWQLHACQETVSSEKRQKFLLLSCLNNQTRTAIWEPGRRLPCTNIWFLEVIATESHRGRPSQSFKFVRISLTHPPKNNYSHHIFCFPGTSPPL